MSSDVSLSVDLQGGLENKAKDQLTENERGILTWLEKNQ